MSALLLAAAAAGFTPPSFKREDLETLQRHFPVGALASGQSAAALIDAQVDPKGRISHCKALAVYGDPQLAGSICGLVDGMKIEPASVQARGAYGVIRQFVRFFLPTTDAGSKIAQLREPSDLEVQVNVLPAGKPSLRVDANVLIDASGKPQACNAGDAPAGYGDLACGQMSGVTFGALHDGDGKPVPYVRRVTVDFITSPASSG